MTQEVSQHETKDQEWVPFNALGMTESRYHSSEVQHRLNERLGEGNHKFEVEPGDPHKNGVVLAERTALEALRKTINR